MFQIEDDNLVIKGEKKSEVEEKKSNYYRSERRYGRFIRSLPGPEDANADKVKAEFKDGVLRIEMPASKKKANAKKIAVK